MSAEYTAKLKLVASFKEKLFTCKPNVTSEFDGRK